MQNDFEQAEIKEMIPENHSSSPKSGPPSPRLWRVNKKHFFKFGIIFAVILILVAGGFYAWDNYFSPSARSARQAEANYQKYLDWQKNYEAAMTADTYGGKTPEETLAMFVDALKNGDTDLASRYFLINEKTPQSAWKSGLDEKKTEGKLSEIIKVVESSQFNEASSWKETAWFVQKNKSGETEHSIILNLNKYSNVWKIENM